MTSDRGCARRCRGTKVTRTRPPSDEKPNCAMPAATIDHWHGGLRSTDAVRWLAIAGLVLGADSSASAGAPDVETQDPPPILIARALAYEHGEGVTKDPLKAAALYCAAARDGDSEAQFSLGWMYANGRGVVHDDAVAASFFALAAPSTSDAVATVEPDPFAELPPWKQKIADQVTKLAPRYALDPRLALSIITVESNFEPRARSGKDARGLMQLIPETAIRFNVANPYDVIDNLRGGLAYLRWLLAYYRGQVALAAAAYNAGEAAVDRYRGIPPYPETRDYVRRVLQLFRSDWHAFDPRVVAPSPFLMVPDAKAK